MSVLPVGFGSSGGIDTGDIGHSLRCRSAASAYLSRTPVNPVISDLWTMSFWIKRGQLGNKMLGGCGTVSGNSFAYCFDATDHLQAYYPGTGAILNAVTNGVFRDPTAFIHIVMSCDLGNAVPADRFQFWVNGVRQTLSTYNFTAGLNFNNNQPQQICSHPVWGLPNDGYMSRICFVDQQQLTPSSFGYLNTEINEWVTKSQSAVKAVVDAGGTNSFMLDFDDATSLTTLGYDKSSKGNNWTLNNFSLTAGTTYDHMLDVPGNSFATLNPLQYNPSNIAAGNLQFTSSTSLCARGTPDLLACGKSYFEFPAAGVNYMGWGVQGGGATASATMGAASAELWGVYNASIMNTIYNGSAAATGVAPPATGGACCVAFDAATGKLWLGYAASGTSAITWHGGGDPAAGTSPSTTVSLTKPVFPHADIQGGGGSQTCTLNAGQYPATANSAFRSAAGGYFHCVPPTGFKALCQANLPDPAILNPEKHFDAVTQLGSAVNTGANLLAQFTNFTADFAWGKDRAAANNHQLVDTVRGSTAVLQSNTTAAETTYSAPTSGDNCVAWGWKMGGAAVTNNNGSISSQVSANVLAGQSVVTYTGTGANATVGHGLASAPELLIIKARSAVGDGSWIVGAKPIVMGTGRLILQTTDANSNAGAATLWNSTAATSSVFSIGTYSSVNSNTISHVALCFHSVPGYSKVGSYIGNGSADGPYVECGFKPKYVLYKNITTGATGWVCFDGERSNNNAVAAYLQPNTSGAEGSSATMDFTTFGFKLRATSTDTNTSGNTYIFYAVADVAGKYSLGR